MELDTLRLVSASKMKQLLVLGVMIFSISALAESSKLDLLWRAKAIQAHEENEKIRGEIKKKGIEKLSNKVRCDLILNAAFEPHQIQPRPNRYYNSTKDSESFLFAITDIDDTEKANRTLLKFLYAKKSFSRPIVSIIELGSKSEVTFVPNDTQQILVTTKNCSFNMSGSNPVEDEITVQATK